MDNPKQDKFKHQFSPAEAADYLRQLADALEQGHISLRSEELELEGNVKVKQKLKTKSGKATLKINLKIVAPIPPMVPAAGAGEGFVEITSEAEAPFEGGDKKTSYKKLKKAMGKSFGSLKDIRKQGGVPSTGDTAAFAAQAREMCTFAKSKYGPESYSRFLAALDRLEAAATDGDLQTLDAALSDLGACRSDCHDKYK